MKTSMSIVIVVVIAILFGGPSLQAQRYRGGARTNVNHNVNVNRNTNVNVNRNVNVNVHGGYYGGYYGGGCCYHPVATAAAVTATAVVTAAVVGSIVHSVPPSCTSVIVNGLAYQQCGSTWYQPQFSGTSTTYVVVNPLDDRRLKRNDPSVPRSMECICTIGCNRPELISRAANLVDEGGTAWLDRRDSHGRS